MPLSKIGVRWGTWRKGIGGPAEPPHCPKVEDVKPTNKLESVEATRQTPGFPPPIKAEERQDPSPQQEEANNIASLLPRAMSSPGLSVSQSQTSVLPATPRPENCTSEGISLTTPTPERSSIFSDIEPEERELMLRIPLELCYPPPPPEHCGDGRFRWKCHIRGCVATLDSASNYTDPFSGISEVEAEWLRRKPESIESELGQEIIYHILCRHYEFHLQDSGVDIVDVGLFYLFGSL